MCIVCASVECIIWNNFRQKRLRPASEFSQPLSTRVLDTPIIFSYLLIFIFIKKKLIVCYIHPHPRGLYKVQNKFCARQRMAHSHWFILCGLSSGSVPSQSRSNPPTDPAPRPSDWWGVENYAASISISHHLLKLQLIQLHLAPSALLSSNSLKLQPMLCACYVVQCACSAMSVDKDFSSLSDVTW